MSTEKGLRENPDASEGHVSIQNVDISKVGIRVPPFWPEEPEVWFAQIEGQFAISGITSDATKFNYIISQMDNITCIEIKDIIINPPASEKYNKLKYELIKRLTVSKEKRIKQLLMHEELGDRKPSQFLRHLKSLAGIGVPDEFVKTIWISRLSHGIQTVLAGQQSSSTLDELADLADRVFEIVTPSPSIAACSKPGTSSAIENLAREVAEIKREFKKIAIERRSRGQTPSRHVRRESRGRSTTRAKRSQSHYRKYPLCWYHYKFGDKAYKCIQPCDFKSGNAQGGQ